MDRNMILAIVLSIAVLIGFQVFFKQTEPVPPPQQGTKQQTPEQKPQAPMPAVTAPQAVPVPVPVAKAPEKQITVENELFRAVLSTRGAVVKKVELKKYKDKDGAPVVLKADETMPGLALGLDEGFQFAGVSFSAIGSDISFRDGDASRSITFDYSGGGISVRRTYTFTRDDYAFTMKDEVRGVDSYLVTPGRGFGIVEIDSSEHAGPVVLKEADRSEYTAKDLKNMQTVKGNVKWLAQEDKYFVAFIVPKVSVEEVRLWSGTTNDALSAVKMKGGENTYIFYAGPKQYNTLEKYGAGMEHVVDFGFFSILARPLFWLLKFLYSLVPNYGVVIILLAIITRVPFIPLINKGQESMKKLAEVQPRIAEIKEKYKSDPQKMQKEIMEMYKKNKVNPMGGCLPMLLQIPVFFALYKILTVSIELRQAPFALWLTDLSAPDTLFGHVAGMPIGLLPLLMGATTLLQQKMTPSTTADPMQKKMMLMMPVVFTFIFLSMPSGVVLYWTIGNLFGIIQQFYVNKKAGAKIFLS